MSDYLPIIKKSSGRPVLIHSSLVKLKNTALHPGRTDEINLRNTPLVIDSSVLPEGWTGFKVLKSSKEICIDQYEDNYAENLVTSLGGQR